MIQDIWLQTKWAVIEFYLWLRSKAFGENDHLKRFEEPNALSRRLGFKSIIGIEDFQYWDTVPVFSPHQAACLISGYSPGFYYGDYPPEVEAIMADLARYFLTSTSNLEALVMRNNTNRRMEKYRAPSFELKRSDLIEYCEINQLEPPFLFPEKRNQLSSAETELVKVKKELAEARKEVEDIDLKTLSAYLDRNHPMFSEELFIAVNTWRELFSSGEDIKKAGKAPTTAIYKWLEKNQKHLSKSAKNRIQTLCNPDIYKQGGTTPTQNY